jgi:uncharacterized repeat protein (TIGR01451 family)
MLRNVSVFACLVVAAIGLVAAAEPQTPASNWVPADRLRESVYRPSDTEAVTLQAAQTGPSSLAERLKAIRGNSPSEDSDTAPTRRTAAPATLPDDATGSQLPSVLVRRGKSASGDSAAPVTNAAETNRGDAGEAVDTGAESGDSMRRTARRNRNETPTFRSPMTSQDASSRSTDNTQLGLTSQGPMISIETAGPRAIVMGKAANYRVRLVNQGSADADRVIVTVAVPAWAQITTTEARFGSVNADNQTDKGRRIVWEMEDVASRSQHELSLSLQPTENRPIDLVVDWVFHGAPMQASIEVQQPQLTMAVDGPTDLRYGATAVFKIKLNNPGNGPAENVTVTVGASGVANQPNTVGTLAAGESRSLEVELTAKQAGLMKIEAAAQGDGNLRAEATHEVRVRQAQLAVKVTAPSMLYAGATATYEIRVANTGDAAAEGVTLELQLPAGNKNAVGVDKKPIENAPPRWRLGDLPPGSDRVYTMQCDLVTGGQNQFAARLQGTDDSAASDTAITTVEALADLKLIVNDPKGPLPVGKDVTYEIQVINRGSKEATNIDLIAQFSEGIEPLSATGHDSEIVPGQVIFKPIASLPAGGQITVKVTAKAQKPGNLQFRAELSCGEPETKLVSEETTRFYGSTAGNSAPQSAERPAGEPTPARR